MAGINLTADNRAWLETFWRRHGRPPRVLHIGNIANNAYNNAKLLNAAGLDCDVICYDYYHIMGCPEWEDADFEGEIKDQFFPDWTSVDLKGFRKPTWFAQGPLDLCFRYLIAKRTGDDATASALWQTLQYYRPGDPVIIKRGDIIAPAIPNTDRGPGPTKVASKWHERVNALTTWRYPVGAIFFYLIRIAHDCAACLRLIWHMFTVMPIALWRLTTKRLRHQLILWWTRNRFDRRVRKLVRLFRIRFPERSDKLSREDLECLRPLIPIWEALFQHYDIIQAYATDPIYPLLANRPYFAFEHGTLREIPRHNSTQGRITALSYSQAQYVFVTNADCLAAAHRLAGDRVTFLNHPYDEDHGVNISGWQELRVKFQQALDADFLFFFPTRQDWVAGTGYADKANDVFIRAFCRLRQSGRRVGMVCCRWGSNVEQSQKLIEEYDCTRHVLWSAPMGIIKFERTAKACDVVADQFKVGAFGGIMFKAMSVGVPICTYLDEAEMMKRFGEAPPVINCRTEGEIVDKLGKLIGNQTVLDELSAAGRTWIKRHHSAADTVAAQMSCYMKPIGSSQKHISGETISPAALHG